MLNDFNTSTALFIMSRSDLDPIKIDTLFIIIININHRMNIRKEGRALFIKMTRLEHGCQEHNSYIHWPIHRYLNNETS
jgi:hypothetical protein